MPAKKGGKRPATARRRAGTGTQAAVAHFTETLALICASYLTLALLAGFATLVYLRALPGKPSGLLPRPLVFASAETRSGEEDLLDAAPSAAASHLLVTPSTITDGWTAVAAGETVTVIGRLPGAERITVTLTPSGTGTASLERVLATSSAGEDGSFAVTLRFTAGTLGQLRARGESDAGRIFESDIINIVSE